jgi:RNA polymerase sigma-70 factor (ECF subfamily)
VSDPELLERLRAGDQTAFDSLFRTHYVKLVRVAEAMLRDRASAEETVQDVMLELWRRRESLTVETSIRAYLFRATRNRALNRIRHERVQRASEPELARQGFAQPADANLVEEEIDVALRRALDDLPARCREVFELSRMHGLKYAEIAHALDISVKTVEAQMGKALRIMRERLSPWLP